MFQQNDIQAILLLSNHYQNILIKWIFLQPYFSVLYRISIEGEGGKPWVSDFNDPNYIAGRKAMTTGINILSNDQTIGFNEENMITTVQTKI